MGTRFVATEECDADVRFKKAYVSCREEDIVIITSPVGLPGRAVRGDFLEAIDRGDKKLFRCPSHCLESCAAAKARYCISEALDCARKGDLENGFAFCGANAHRVEDIVPVKQLVAGLKQGYALAAFVGALKTEAARKAAALEALRDEYAATLAGFRGKAQAGLNRMIEEHESRFRDDMARVHEKLAEIKAEYAQIKERLRELGGEIAGLMTLEPALAAV
jgi:hypothetical protein